MAELVEPTGTDTPQFKAEIADLVAPGNTLEAIRRLHKAGMTLLQVRREVDALRVDEPWEKNDPALIGTTVTVVEHHTVFPREVEPGWLSPGAAEPLRVKPQPFEIRAQIVYDPVGYRLFVDELASGSTWDTWRQRVDEAKATAEYDFGVTADEWRPGDGANR